MVSLLTALHIQANESLVATHGNDNDKYGFEIYSIIREKYRPHLTSGKIYDSSEIAKSEGENLLKEIESLDLSGKRKELSDTLGDAAETVKEVISASKA